MIRRLSFVKILNYLLILSAVALVVWLISVNFPLCGQYDLKADFENDQPMLSKLGPAGRVEAVGDGAIISDSPVYFDLRALPWYWQLRLRVTYRVEGRDLEGIGPQLGSGWNYQVARPLAVTDEPNGDKTAVFDFDLKNAYRPKNVIRFIVSTAAAGDGAKGMLIIKNLSLTLKR